MKILKYTSWSGPIFDIEFGLDTAFLIGFESNKSQRDIIMWLGPFYLWIMI